MGLFNRLKAREVLDKPDEAEQRPRKQLGLEIKMPGCSEFVPLGKWQYQPIYSDSLGPRLLCIIDEVAELLEPSGVKTTEGKEEDALKAEIVGLIKSVTQLGRSSGMHIILAPLSLDTIIPTTKGYVTMGEIEPGETVFLPNGKPVSVLQTSPVKMARHMYRLTLSMRNFGGWESEVTVKADGDHYFPVMVRGWLERCNVDRIYALFRQAYNLKICGAFNQMWNIDSVEPIQQEPVKCVLVDDFTHQFLIVGERSYKWRGGEKWSEAIPAVSSYNTQRNDASIIPGVIQNNSLAAGTRLRIRRKVDGSDL